MAQLSKFDKHMTAVAFAEAGEHETARTMLNEAAGSKKSPAKKHAPASARPSALKVLVLGVFSIGLYYSVFANEQLVTDFYTKGKWYAALPILTVFVFSFVHGAFASDLLSFCGIEAKKK